MDPSFRLGFLLWGGRNVQVVCGRSDAKAAVEAGALQPGEFAHQQQAVGHKAFYAAI